MVEAAFDHHVGGVADAVLCPDSDDVRTHVGRNRGPVLGLSLGDDPNEVRRRQDPLEPVVVVDDDDRPDSVVEHLARGVLDERIRRDRIDIR